MGSNYAGQQQRSTKNNPVILTSLAIAAILSFSVGDGLTKKLTSHYPIFEVLALKCATGSAIMILIIAIRRESVKINDIGPTIEKWFSVQAALWCVTVWLFALSFQMGTLSQGWTTIAMFPLIVMVIQYKIYGTIPRSIIFIPICLMICGIVLYNFETEGPAKPLNYLFPALTAVAYAVYLVVSEGVGDLIKREEVYFPLTTQTLFLFIAGLVIFSLGSVISDLFFSIKLEIPSGADGLTIFSSGATLAIGIFSLNFALLFGRAGEAASQVAPFEYLSIPFDMAIDVFFFQKFPNRPQFFCAAMIFFSAVAFSIFSGKKLK